MKSVAPYVIFALFLVCAGCSDSVQRLVDRTRQAATADEWRTWAAQVIECAKTNSTPMPSSEWPEFVRRTGTHWQLHVSHPDADTNGPTLVMLVALGGFESTGIIIGPSSYVEIAPPHYPQISREVYPGIYVREVH